MEYYITTVEVKVVYETLNPTDPYETYTSYFGFYPSIEQPENTPEAIIRAERFIEKLHTEKFVNIQVSSPYNETPYLHTDRIVRYGIVSKQKQLVEAPPSEY